MKKVNSILLVFFMNLLCFCSSPKENNPIIGNWFFFRPDSTYCEIYINDSAITFMCEDYLSCSYRYIEKDQYYEIISLTNMLGDTSILKIINADHNYLRINWYNQTEQLYFLQDDIPDIFKLRNDDTESHHKFLDMFFERRNKIYSDSTFIHDFTPSSP